MSYSWSILRLALIKLSTHKIQEFIKVAGIELQGEHHEALLAENID